eukprot:10250260-Alexandrium_andersonii.AAC.1
MTVVLSSGGLLSKLHSALSANLLRRRQREEVRAGRMPPGASNNFRRFLTTSFACPGGCRPPDPPVPDG